MTSKGIHGGLHPNGTDALGSIQEGLCDRCQRLRLGPDSFTIRKQTTSSGRGRPAAFQMKSGGYQSNFATVEDLTTTSEDCKLCDLLCKAISRYSRPHPADKKAICSLTREVDGRKAGGRESSPNYNHWPTSGSDRSPFPIRVSNAEYLARRHPHSYEESTSTDDGFHRYRPSRVSDHTPSHHPDENPRAEILESRDREQEFSRHRPSKRSYHAPSYGDERVRKRVRTLSQSRERNVDNQPRSGDGMGGNPQTARSDRYGRWLSNEVPRESDFRSISIIPDHPFGVSRYDTATVPDEEVERYMPILQFFTWSTDLHVLIRKPDTRTDCNGRSAIRKCDIVDKNGDWCGFLPVDRTIIDHRDGRLFLFIAISEAEAFTMEEWPVETYYVPQERSESKWDPYFVMMLVRNDERGLWERAGLGKVFQSAFMDKEWGEFKLG